MRRETVLDTAGMPFILPARDEDGQLGFYTLNRYAGGRVVLDAVPDDVLRGMSRPAGATARRLAEQIREVADGVAASIMAGDAARQARVAELEAQLADANEQLETRDAEIAELRATLHQQPPGAGGKPRTRRAHAAA